MEVRTNCVPKVMNGIVCNRYQVLLNFETVIWLVFTLIIIICFRLYYLGERWRKKKDVACHVT